MPFIMKEKTVTSNHIRLLSTVKDKFGNLHNWAVEMTEEGTFPKVRHFAYCTDQATAEIIFASIK